MCEAYLPKGSRHFKPHHEKLSDMRKAKRSQHQRVRRQHKQQLTISDCFGCLDGNNAPTNAIEASGDVLTDKDPNIIRFAFQNVNGISMREGLDVMPETATIGSLQLDVTALTETNVHWNKATQEKMTTQLYQHLGPSRIVCASHTTTEAKDGYQPGGSMIAVVGPQLGRIARTGSDPWGRFTWTELTGRRDEGILVISAYRVSQRRGAIAGPTTAYSQQINSLIKEGDLNLDPRTRILQDLRNLIVDKRAEGFRPVLMMDANDDWLESSSVTFKSFIDELQLEDPHYTKGGELGMAQTTYARGRKRIDFILVDRTIVPSIKKIGTLALHEGIVSDHVMLYMDCDETQLFGRVINQPVLNPSRELVIEHADKCESFIEKFRTDVNAREFPERIQRLSQAFKLKGATDTNQTTFQILDTEISECIKRAAKFVAKKKFGYQRSTILTGWGTELHFWKATLSAKVRGACLGNLQVEQATKRNISLDDVASMTPRTVRAKIRSTRAHLWAAQKNAAKARIEWLEQNAQNISRAAGEINWKKKMTDMATRAQDRSVNRKMTNATKGTRKGLNSVEVPQCEWLYSPTAKELYRYTDGVFECYAAQTPQPGLIPTDPERFYLHHHLKVPPDDIVQATVDLGNQCIRLITTHEACPWREVTNPREIERLILRRNKRHLQQASIEDGRVHDPVMQELISKTGPGDLLEDLRNGRLTLDEATDEAIQAWFSALQQTASHPKTTMLSGKITREDLQGGFKSVSERTTSSPSGMHYSIWKCLAREDDIAEWLSTMMSLPFMYGFSNKRWTKMVDVMLEKKRGVRRIHQLRIIGILEADFNTALKILIARNLMSIAEAAGDLHNEQWGSRANRTSTDAALRKMMTFEYGRYMRATIGLFANDQTACFDRMWAEVTNVVAAASGCDSMVQRCRLKTIDAMRRHCKTGLGVSEGHYGNTSSDESGDDEILAAGPINLTPPPSPPPTIERSPCPHTTAISKSTPPEPLPTPPPTATSSERTNETTVIRPPPPAPDPATASSSGLQAIASQPTVTRAMTRSQRQSTSHTSDNTRSTSSPTTPPRTRLHPLFKALQPKPGRARIKGEIQGKADVASLWALVSSTLLAAHALLYCGLNLPSVCGKPTGIKKNNDAYVDDVDTWSGQMGYGHLVANNVMTRLNSGAQKWSNVQDVVAASTAFHKCMCQALAWAVIKGSLMIDYAYTYEMTLHDIKGARTKIKFLPSNQPNQGLGFNLAPDGQQTHELKARIMKIKHMCSAAVSMHLSQTEAENMLRRRLVPQTTYGMRLSSFTQKECHRLDVLVLRTFLPLLTINRCTPRAVVHGPLQYGGMNIDSHSSLQDQWGLHYLVQTLRWDNITANDVITALDAYQLVTGFATPVLLSPTIEIDYVGIGWIPHIRNRLRALNGQLAIEKAWRPSLQRINDDSIMEPIAACGDLTRKERRLANEFRLYIRVTCISCLAGLDGQGVPYDRLTGLWRAEPAPGMTWPDLPQPTPEHAAAFRRCLRHTICTTASPWQRAGQYPLDEKLGAWLIRPRLCLFDCYISRQAIHWRDEFGTYLCRPSGTTNFYDIDYSHPSTPPTESHPVAARKTSTDRVFIWKRYRPHTVAKPPSSNCLLGDTFQEIRNDRLNLVSDASIHTTKRKAAGAWQLSSTSTDKNGKRRVVRTLEHQRHAHSYRHELETFYHALDDTTNTLKQSHTITQHMDNEGGLTKLGQEITTPGQTMATDMDLVLAYKKLRTDTHHTVHHQWVMGHADEKKKDNPKQITAIERENIACDEAANTRVDQDIPPTPFTPLPGYRAMLKLGDDWITTHFRGCVQFSNTSPAMKNYILQRLDITLDIFHTIDWDSIGTVRSSHHINRVVRTSKMLYGWLPVGHNWLKCNLTSDKCPCCGAPDETFAHLLQCKHTDLALARSVAYTTIENKSRELKIPKLFTTTFLSLLKVTLEGIPFPSSFPSPELECAARSQHTIGMYNMVIGFFSKEWTTTLETMGLEHPKTIMAQMLSMTWDHICEALWKTRNQIKHSPESHVATDEMTDLQSRLSWYLRHQNDVLDYRHRFLVDYSDDSITRMSRTTRRAKLELLNNARTYYETECLQRATNQSTIFDWLHSYKELRSGRLVGEGIRDAWAKGRRPHPTISSNDNDSMSDEAEFY